MFTTSVRALISSILVLQNVSFWANPKGVIVVIVRFFGGTLPVLMSPLLSLHHIFQMSVLLVILLLSHLPHPFRFLF